MFGIRAVSSVVECAVHIGEVVGPIPTLPTMSKFKEVQNTTTGKPLERPIQKETELVSEKEKQFKQHTQKGIESALEKIRGRFENDPQEENNLEFHNIKHTQSVIKRVESILKIIQESDPSIISRRDIDLSKLAASFHDVVQKWEAVQVNGGSQSRN